MDQILIFKTNVDSPMHVLKVEGLFRSIHSIIRWNFDLEDCDRILRVVVSDIHMRPEMIEQLLRSEGICCEYLEF